MGGHKKIKQYLLKALVAILGLLVVGVALYILIFPFYPEIKYRLAHNEVAIETVQKSDLLTPDSQTSLQPTAEPTQAPAKELPAAAGETKVVNRLIIPKIDVNIPIIDSSDSRWALNRGAWRLPETSTPDQGGNTAIAGHRFKYLPPSNLTFYLLDKLTVGDEMTIIWSGRQYRYRVSESKIVPPTQVSVLAPTEKPILTLITCDPIWTQTNRLIVTGELISQP